MSDITIDFDSETEPQSEIEQEATETIAELQQRLRRLERKVRGLVADGAAGTSASSAGGHTSYSASSRGSWTSEDSRRLGGGATSEAMAAIEAKRAASVQTLPARPGRELREGDSGEASAFVATSVSSEAIEQAVAEAISRQLQTTDLEGLLRAAVIERLKELDVRSFLIEEARSLMTGDRFRTVLAEALKDGTLLDGKTPEQLTQDALTRVFDGDGEDGLLEKAMIKALNGRRPEELLSAKVGELFDRLSKRVTS